MAMLNNKGRAVVHILLFALVCAVLLYVGFRLTPGSAEGAPVSAVPAQGLRISEAMYRNQTAYMDEDGEYPDWVELHNVSGAPLNIEGYGLTDRPQKGVKWRFPSVTVPTDGYVVVFMSGKNRAPAKGELHASFGLRVGESVALFDQNGEHMDELLISATEQDASLQRVPDGSFAASPYYSPGYPNTDAGHEAVMASHIATQTDVVINEVVPVNRTTLPDETGAYHDWLELRNLTDKDVDLSGWALSDTPGRPMLWRFPAGTLIKAKGYLVVYCSEQDRPAADGFPAHTNFAISASGETLTLTDKQGMRHDEVLVQDVPDDRSYGRVESTQDDWRVYRQPTPGLPNTEESARAVEAQFFANNKGLSIDKAVSRNADVLQTSPGAHDDFVELVNRTGADLNLKGYGLSDDVGRPLMWTFPDVTIKNGGRLSVICSGDESKTNLSKGEIHTLFRLGADGDEIVLADPQRNVLDKIALPALKQNMGYGRIEGKPGFFYFTEVHAGQAETAGYEGIAPEPVFSLGGGSYQSAQQVTLTAPEGVTVRYTLDGSPPTPSSTAYNGPISVSKTSVVRARAFGGNDLPSETVTHSYIINEPHAMPIISIALKPDDLFSDATGILANGPGWKQSVADANQPNKGANYWKNWEREASIEYYDESGVLGFSQTAGLKVNGAYSRDRAQKSFAVNARSVYGTKRFSYNPFDNRDYEEYKNFILRTSSQDSNRARMRDAVLTSLAEGTGVMYQAAKPVALYLNGAYWGHYNLRERVNVHMIANFEGITDPAIVDKIDIMEGDGKAKHGSAKEWKEIMDFLNANRLTSAENLKWISERIDIENYFYYAIMEMWTANSDTGNIRWYKVPGGKWKWILYDLDWAMNTTQGMGPTWDSIAWYTKEKGHGVSSMFSTLLIRRLLEVPQLREQFLAQLSEMMKGNLASASVLSRIDAYAAQLQPEMAAHFARWPSDGSVSTWEKHVERLRTWTRERNKNMAEFAENYFHLSDARTRELFPEGE